MVRFDKIIPGPQLLLNHPNMVGQLGSVGMNMQPRGLAQHQHPIINFSAHHNSLVQHTMVPHLVGQNNVVAEKRKPKEGAPLKMERRRTVATA